MKSNQDKVNRLLEKDLNDCQEQFLIILSSTFKDSPIKGFKTLDVVLFAAALMGDKISIPIETLEQTMRGYDEAIKQFRFDREYSETIIFKTEGEA